MLIERAPKGTQNFWFKNEKRYKNIQSARSHSKNKNNDSNSFFGTIGEKNKNSALFGFEEEKLPPIEKKTLLERDSIIKLAQYENWWWFNKQLYNIFDNYCSNFYYRSKSMKGDIWINHYILEKQKIFKENVIYVDVFVKINLIYNFYIFKEIYNLKAIFKFLKRFSDFC